jgi:hypothetical protein
MDASVKSMSVLFIQGSGAQHTAVCWKLLRQGEGKKGAFKILLGRMCLMPDRGLH